MTRRRRRRGCVVALLIAAIVTVAALVIVPQALDRHSDRLFSRSLCTVSLGDESHTLTAEQTNNAALIAARSAERALPARAATIAIATAIQESSLRNIDYGDRDSVGLFQQRPSQGWGSVDQIMDPYYSTDTFYEALIRVRGWREMPITEAAQEVQRSAFPEAYGNHEPAARLWASALRGFSGPRPVTCRLGVASVGTVDAFTDRVAADFGDGDYVAEVVGTNGNHTIVALTPRSGTLEDRHTVAAWAVAVANTTSVHAVTVDGAGWSRDSDDYRLEVAVPAGAVAVEIRTAP